MSTGKNHKDNAAQQLNKSFENWDAGSPSDSLWDKLNSSLDQTSTLEESFDDWQTSNPSNAVWENLTISLDQEIQNNRTASNEPQSLNAAFDNWEVEEPGDLWNKLDEELSTASVWDKLSNSLDEESGAVVDTKFKAAYQEWSTGTNHDGWTKLDDALSRERVWNRLAVSLTQPVGLPSIWWKYAASLIAFTFLSFFMSDGVHINTSTGNLEAINKGNDIETDAPDNGIKDTHPDHVTENRFAVNTTNLNQNQAQNHDRVNQNYARNNNAIDNNIAITDLNSNLNNSTSNTVQTNLASSDFMSDNLSFLQTRELGTTDNCANVGRIHFYEPKNSSLSATFAFGTQLSQSRNDNRSNLSSCAPRLGLALDLAFNKDFGRWGLRQDFGYTQFTQLNGDYVKGRYQNSIQQLSTLQATTGVYYSFNRIDLNGGVVFTRILNGLEQEDNKIINVYNTNKIQTGISAGVTYNLSPKRDKVRYGVGLQYQWIPNINAGTTSFRDVQGVKVQAKISF